MRYSWPHHPWSDYYCSAPFFFFFVPITEASMLLSANAFNYSFCLLLTLLLPSGSSKQYINSLWRYINSLWRRHICRCAFSSPLIGRKLHCTFAVSIQKSSKTSPHPSDSISSAHSSLLVARELFFSVALGVSESEFSGQNSGVGVCIGRSRWPRPQKGENDYNYKMQQQRCML